MWKCRRNVHNNTVRVRQHRVSKYTTLTKSCFVLRNRIWTISGGKRRVLRFHSGFCVTSGGTSTPRGRLLEAQVRFDGSFKYLAAYMGLEFEPHTRKVPLLSTLDGYCVKGRTATFSCSSVHTQMISTLGVHTQKIHPHTSVYCVHMRWHESEDESSKDHSAMFFLLFFFQK